MVFPAAAIIVALAQAAPGADTVIVAPRLPVATTNGGEALLHLRLDAAGAPARIVAISGVSPFAEALRAAVREWRLPWASVEGGPDILVAGVFRPPALLELGNLPTPPPPAIAPPLIAFPVEWVRPAYPPRALGDATVIVEVRVRDDGGLRSAAVVQSAPGFDAAALDAAWRWRFRPAVRDGRAVRTIAFLVFGFRGPVTPARPVPR